MGWILYWKCLKFSDICTHFNSVQLQVKCTLNISRFLNILIQRLIFQKTAKSQFFVAFSKSR